MARSLSAIRLHSQYPWFNHDHHCQCQCHHHCHHYSPTAIQLVNQLPYDMMVCVSNGDGISQCIVSNVITIVWYDRRVKILLHSSFWLAAWVIHMHICMDMYVMICMLTKCIWWMNEWPKSSLHMAPSRSDRIEVIFYHACMCMYMVTGAVLRILHQQQLYSWLQMHRCTRNPQRPASLTEFRLGSSKAFQNLLTHRKCRSY